jgi:hypothetical protein
MKRHIILQHNNACSHTAHPTLGKIEKCSLEVLPNPPYSLDFAPSDYYVFGPLKVNMGSQQYENNEAIQYTMRTWLENTETDFYHSGIFKLTQCWQKCLNCSGESVE